MAGPPNVTTTSNPGPSSESPAITTPLVATFDAFGNMIQAYGAGGVPVPLLTNPMTTAGDIIIGGAAGAAQRLAVGSGSQVLGVSAGLPAWVASSGGSPPPVNPQTGTTYTLALTDAPASSANQGIVTMNNAAANTLTIPTHATVAFPNGTSLQVIQIGAGQTTIAAAGGVTFHNPSSATARAQYSTLVITQIAQDSWILSGDMT